MRKLLNFLFMLFLFMPLVACSYTGRNAQVVRTQWDDNTKDGAYYIINSVEELNNYITEGNENRLSQNVEGYDSTFFEEKSLVLVLISEGSGSVSHKLKDIKMPVVIPAVDLMDCKEYIFTNNPPEEKERYITDITVGKAVRASSSFTAVFSPCEYKEHAFVDGGALDNIPVEEVKKQGADIVIGVKFNSDEITENSNIMDMTMKTIDLMSEKISEENISKANFVLNVYTDKTGLLDIDKLDSCYKYGYNAVIENLDQIKELIGK